MRFNTACGESTELAAPPDAAGQRLDVFLATALAAPSRTYVRRLLDLDLVQIEPGKAKPGYRMKGGESIVVFVPELVEMSAEPEPIALNILFEDRDIIVINKQAGIVVHPSPGHETSTLVNGLLHHCRDLSGIGGTLRPGIVHRLDLDTTGCMVAAKNDHAHQELTARFAARTVRKTYLAITHGVPRPAAGRVEGRIGRHPRHRQKQAMLKEGGRHSLTLYRTLETRSDFSLVECDLRTGRTHQVRVHMRHAGAPLICDQTYGPGTTKLPPALSRVISRQALHAWKLEFDHPATGERLAFTAGLPDDMREALAVLGIRGNSHARS